MSVIPYQFYAYCGILCPCSILSLQTFNTIVIYASHFSVGVTGCFVVKLFICHADITDVDTLLPGYLDDTRNWFRVYKRADGKPFNSFAFDGAFKNRSFAERVVEETHKFWNQLMDDQAEGDIDRC